jgi:hypothetical protein
MAQNGVAYGVILLLAVIGVGLSLAAKAAASVRQFREEHHESFLGGRDES